MWEPTADMVDSTLVACYEERWDLLTTSTTTSRCDELTAGGWLPGPLTLQPRWTTHSKMPKQAGTSFVPNVA